MATCNRVVAALNFLTGEGVDYYPDNCNDKSIEALISDYFDGNANEDSGGSDSEESPDESGRKMKVLYIKILVINDIIQCYIGNTRLYNDR